MDLTFNSDFVRRHSELVHTLSGDLRRLESRAAPSFEDRIGAPLITDWEITYRLELALTGQVEGRPGLCGGPVTTSTLFFLDEQLGCARTLNRFYLLGKRRA
ncbi:hypothetical protein ASG47_07295 [Devosia sp. Leaf420]|uniref:hypothetical protein n=1 Tax=Devosia sp. Leaf420 TaxID=1736374 RepID=UPI0007127B4C|nr:hypothetical protein [Devosia sp. Leaf420]KQT48168.1 hypothetical protein ASG47_07295 [Devosia sp. Leaf420]